MSTESDKKVNPWQSVHSAEIDVKFTVEFSDSLTPDEIERWATTVGSYPELSGYLEHGSRFAQIRFTLHPLDDEYRSWTNLGVDAAGWFARVLASAVENWPDLTFDRAELDGQVSPFDHHAPEIEAMMRARAFEQGAPVREDVRHRREHARVKATPYPRYVLTEELFQQYLDQTVAAATQQCRAATAAMEQRGPKAAPSSEST